MRIGRDRTGQTGCLRLVIALLTALVAIGLWLPAGTAVAQESSEALRYTWRQAYFNSADGTRLHADILRHPDLPAEAKTPVILTVSPYLNHSGTDPTVFDPTLTGPSTRFFDFLTLGRVLERGYTYMMVDLRGFGGSGGCTDWGGPGEQSDVKAAVEWAGSQPWSNGRVGMFGKSYDGWTGLMAIANRPKHLAAVVSMEPVYDGYRYLYTNGVRYPNSVVTPPLFATIDAMPGSVFDAPDYHANGTGPNAACYAVDVASQQSDAGDDPFWKARELVGTAKGATTPLLLTQGFLETNTKPDAAFAFFDGMAGPKWAWFGQFDHVRGYERIGGEPATGRDGFAAQAMRFFDRYVAGTPAPVGKDPAVVVQGIDGRYRSEASWPPADAITLSSPLRTGSYADDGQNEGNRSGDAPARIWSISQPLKHAVHLAGEPVLNATVVTTTPRANLVANVYDIDPDGNTLMISRGAMLLRAGGESTVALRMYGQDWPIPTGHRIGVAVSGANSEWWLHVPANGSVRVTRAGISLPFLRDKRARFLDGKAAPRLREFRGQERFFVDPSTVGSSSTVFTLPAPLRRPPAVGGTKTSLRPALPATGVPGAQLWLLGILFVAAATMFALWEWQARDGRP